MSTTNGTTLSPATVGGASIGCSPCGINSCCASRDELKKTLTPLQYQITQEKGTERAFTGKYYKLKDDGIYSCVVCGEELFSSDTKYESGSGWPAFYDVVDKRKVKLKHDLSHVGGNLLLLAMKPGLARTEVSCAKCASHLGHVFDDGPKPTGKRFCINSAALDFVASASGGDGSGDQATATTPTTTTEVAGAATAPVPPAKPTSHPAASKIINVPVPATKYSSNEVAAKS